MHWLFDHAFEDLDGSVLGMEAPELSEGFLMSVLERTNTCANPLYWTLQEFIYASGTCAPINWAAAAEKAHRPNSTRSPARFYSREKRRSPGCSKSARSSSRSPLRWMS